MAKIKSPLRYPGGKSRAIKKILPLIPDFSEFREPFVGGGSVFIAVRQEIKTNAVFKINDLNYDLYCFWKCARDILDEMVEGIKKIKGKSSDGRDLFNIYNDYTCKTELDFAIRFFILNRITFSGTVDSGGYSQQAFENRFTDSSIERLSQLKTIMKDLIITNEDYEKSLLEEGENVFIFLDPPYFRSMKSKLYGKNGDLHTSFDHKRFAKNVEKCNHKWLITYDDSPEIRELFDFANICEWELQYGMNNYKKNFAKKGKELFVSNYKIKSKMIKFRAIDRFL